MKTVIFVLMLLITVVACQKSKTTNNNTSTSETITTTGGTQTGGSTTGPSTGGTTSGTSSGSSGGINCSGEASDGVGSGQALRLFNLTLAGYQNWFPGQVSGIPDWVPTAQESSLLLSTDARFKVRFKVLSQPIPPAPIQNPPSSGNFVYSEYCYGRVTGLAADAHTYTKLKFKVALRDVILSNGTYSLGPAYQHRTIGPINVDSCSTTQDFSAVRNATSIATVVEVSDVRADITCQTNGTKCPAEELVRRASCWAMRMQVATDQTQDLP